MDYFVVRAKQQRTEFLEWYYDLKRNKPCVDCNEIYPHYIMDWDHLPGSEKVENIASLGRRGNKTAILKEIKKCELVCANCHRERTWKRQHADVV